jgi:stress-induced-phosphoprotein 1
MSSISFVICAFHQAIVAYQSSLTESSSDEVSKKLKECKRLKKEHEEKSYLDENKAIEAKDKGNEHFRNGEFADALKYYEESLRRNPNAPAVYSNMAACFGKLGDFPRAIAFCDKCLSLDGKFGKWFNFSFSWTANANHFPFIVARRKGIYSQGRLPVLPEG